MFERKFAPSGIWTHVPPLLVGCDNHYITRIDNHAGNTAIEEVIYMVKEWASR